MNVKNIILIIIVVAAFIGLGHFFSAKKTKTETMEDLLNNLSIEKMQKDIKEQVEIHKKYVMELKGINSQIKDLTMSIDKKMKIAQGFGDVGDVYLKEKLLPIALENYKTGLEIFPQDAFLNYKMGLVLSQLGSYYPDKRENYYTKAEKFYQLSANINTSYAEPHYSLALLYLVSSEQKIKVGSLQQALVEINTFLNINSRKIEAYFLKGRIAFALGDKKTAILAYQPILNLTQVGSADYNKAKANIGQLSGSF